MKSHFLRLYKKMIYNELQRTFGPESCVHYSEARGNQTSAISINIITCNMLIGTANVIVTMHYTCPILDYYFFVYKNNRSII